ncbi:4'-phosphopantetheinyl transferase [Dichotomocladium elegans]|nr:4'-phosphopantetheinyl transferase [Dichotomocladium elegans]
MILGIGVDIVYLPRIAGLVARRGRGPLARRILSPVEHKEFIHRFPKDDQQMTEQVIYLGSRWCVKEAAYKALYPVCRLEWKQVTVAKEQDKPVLKLSNGADGIVGRSHVSLSHDTDYAVAQVIFEAPN